MKGLALQHWIPIFLKHCKFRWSELNFSLMDTLDIWENGIQFQFRVHFFSVTPPLNWYLCLCLLLNLQHIMFLHEYR